MSLAVNDWLLAPNTDAALPSLKRKLKPWRVRCSGASFTLERDNEPRKRLNITLKSERSFDVQALLGNLQAA
jgi:hypothetical protein